ncbi:MAG: AmmeMemoRadiSam system protein B [Anaerolineae bacterium]|nr:AmmeMemoRadiSam system protein B [Anaerolineae bacterium]
MTEETGLRPSPIAGLWYSHHPAQLKKQIKTFINQAELPDLNGEVMGIIAPHAGYRYSGRTAGYAFKCVEGLSPELVVVISPLHNYHPAPYLTSKHSAYQTPLGAVEIDHQALAELDEALEADNGLPLEKIAHDKEHSLEIELPFLQCSLQGPFQLLPVMVRHQTAEIAQRLGKALAKILNSRRFLLVASTDLSHFYPENQAQLLDHEMLRQISTFNPDAVIETELRGKGFACGIAAVASVLWASRRLGATSVKLLHHSTSSEETGDLSSVVGYGAAAILKAHNLN